MPCTRLLLHQFLVAKTTEKHYSLTTDSKEASYEASYKALTQIRFYSYGLFPILLCSKSVVMLENYSSALKRSF